MQRALLVLRVLLRFILFRGAAIPSPVSYAHATPAWRRMPPSPPSALGSPRDSEISSRAVAGHWTCPLPLDGLVLRRPRPPATGKPTASRDAADRKKAQVPVPIGAHSRATDGALCSSLTNTYHKKEASVDKRVFGAAVSTGLVVQWLRNTGMRRGEKKKKKTRYFLLQEKRDG